MPNSLVFEAELEVARFLASQPSPEALISLHPSQATVTRFYELVEMQRASRLSDEARAESEAFLALEHFMQLIKVEAHNYVSPFAPS